MSLWRHFAREFTKITSFIPKPVIRIAFNYWFSSKSYRESVASQFGLKNNDITMNIMTTVSGKGSHFDTLKDYGNKANTMKVLERWKFYKDNALYWHVIDSLGSEYIELNHKIFNWTPERGNCDR
jgi:hypothetical protein